MPSAPAAAPHSSGRTAEIRHKSSYKVPQAESARLPVFSFPQSASAGRFSQTQPPYPSNPDPQIRGFPQATLQHGRYQKSSSTR